MNNDNPLNHNNMDRIEELSKGFEDFFKETAKYLQNMPEKDITDKILHGTLYLSYLGQRSNKIRVSNADFNKIFHMNKQKIRDLIAELKRSSSSSAGGKRKLSRRRRSVRRKSSRSRKN
jgi:hypothetical protein